MSIVDYFAANPSIANIPELLNLGHHNPLGLPLVVQLVLILLVVGAISYFDYYIRNKGKMNYYPILLSLFAFALVLIYYYCFQKDFPVLFYGKFATSKPCIGWFCQHEIPGVGWVVAIIGMAGLIYVIYTLLTALLQSMAGFCEQASMLESKPWKEWKSAISIYLVGVTAVGICAYVGAHATPWVLLATLVVLVGFVIGKVIYDIVRFHKVGWSLLMGLFFLLGVMAAVMLTLECLSASIFLLIILLVLFSRAKASKKQPQEEKK